MSQQHNNTTAKNATIKIAAKEASQRAASGGSADPGPGDVSAAPSVAPQLVEIPDPPTSSQLVVKSTSGSKQLSAGSSQPPPPPTSQANEGSSLPPPTFEQQQPEVEESPRTGTASTTAAAGPQASVSGGGGGGGSTTAAKSVVESHKSGSTSPAAAKSVAYISHRSGSLPAAKSLATHSSSHRSGVSSPATKSTIAESQRSIPQTARKLSGGPTSQKSVRSAKSMSLEKGVASSPGFKTVVEADGQKSVSSPGASKSPMLSDMKFSHDKSSPTGASKTSPKVTKFRYHKRIVVRTKGNTNPNAVMDKVTKKAGNTRLTPSTIEDMEPEELMRRAGIKGTNKTHWRVRLRQTKRLTKDGKTTTQTKVAYRDSEGNKRVKTSLSPFCKTCGKKLEECKCESNSES